MPFKQPHAFESTESQWRSCVHIVPGVRTSAFALPTHAFAWHAVFGAQSSSFVHASSETTGSHSAQPHSFPPAEKGLSVLLAEPESFFAAGGSSSDDTGEDEGTGLTGAGVSSHATGMARTSANPTTEVIEQRSMPGAVYWPPR